MALGDPFRESPRTTVSMSVNVIFNFRLTNVLTTCIRCAAIGCKLKQNAHEGCNSCASLAGLVLSFIACFILLVIAPYYREMTIPFCSVELW